MARRNSNGEGTIYRRKDGRYEGAVYVLTTSGTRKRVRLYGATRAEVHVKLTEAKAKNDQGIPATDKSWLVGDYLDYWLESVIKPNRRPTTYEAYEGNIRLYLKPGLGTLKLTQVTVPVLQRFLNQQLSNGRSVRKVEMLKETLSPALGQAMYEELLTRNVARLVKLPSYESDDVEPWTPAEVTRFFDAAKDHRWYPAFLLVALYGLRRGEVLGLRWSDIDVKAAVIRVRQQVVRANGTIHIGPLKTRAGRRDLPLLSAVADELVEHRVRQVSTSDADLVFTTSTGHSIEPNKLTQTFYAICAQYSLRRIKLHHLRHTAATILKDLGVPARDAQLILGHSNIAITQQIYQHDTMDSRRSAMERMETAVLPSTTMLRASKAGLDGNGSRQNSRQTRKNPVSLLGSFDGAGTGTLSRNRPTLGGALERVTEVNAILRESRRQWMLGVVAVNLAVRNQELVAPNLHRLAA
ncbi:MAG TPA: site-specific integrase [Actinocrinis sp.]|jgi:integrase|uniref:tyrosine-type recombinase/integrase n=1 Tax=Actinocrinis sp. TaxID=1920516 RepID=UPI002DDCBE29|nr:site-specific integrase [Actinocrinis sp.]HEV3170372.1 site-specific integrase [Actinocrinis sp.]